MNFNLKTTFKILFLSFTLKNTLKVLFLIFIFLFVVQMNFLSYGLSATTFLVKVHILLIII